MKAEQPAEGILKSNDWGDTKAYQIVCGCGQPDHDHNLWVEAEDTGVNVVLYITAKSKWWSMNRWKQMWVLLTKGYIEHESVITMSEQQALNYAETLKSAIKDVAQLRKERISNKESK